MQTVAETVGQNKEVQEIGRFTLKLVDTAIEKYQKEIEDRSERSVAEQKK